MKLVRSERTFEFEGNRHTLVQRDAYRPVEGEPDRQEIFSARWWLSHEPGQLGQKCTREQMSVLEMKLGELWNFHYYEHSELGLVIDANSGTYAAPGTNLSELLGPEGLDHLLTVLEEHHEDIKAVESSLWCAGADAQLADLPRLTLLQEKLGSLGLAIAHRLFAKQEEIDDQAAPAV